jgi:putative oxygen-independent coproporphyrinogen III oxidase
MLISNPSEIPSPQQPVGLYVHIPFCVRKCAYCDFYSLAGKRRLLSPYIDALLLESARYSSMELRTLYIGGGTPSLLTSPNLDVLINGLHKHFDLSNLIEVSIEANPDSSHISFLAAALSHGINRISFGVQSLNDIELRRVGRLHSASQAVAAIEKAKTAGFKNISADLMIGLPGQSLSSLMSTISRTVELNLQHISLYCLSVEPGTPLAADIPSDLPSQDEQADLYERSVDLLEQCGFVHYEISNFARPGFECLHNLNYWRAGEYAGLGPSAASHFGGKRYKNKPDLEGYLRDPLSQIFEDEHLSDRERAVEEAVLRLRLLKEGLDITQLAAKYGKPDVAGLLERLDSMVEKKYLTRSGSIYRLSEGTALVSNSILSGLFE